MKKLIAISVIFALVAGAAFAEATLGGQLMIGTTLLKGDSGDSEKIMMGTMGFHEAKMTATFGDSKGGGLLKLVASDPNGTAYEMALNARSGSDKDGLVGKDGTIFPWGFLYWQPNAKFRMQVGLNADGDFGAAKISGWGFTGEAKNSVAAISDYAYGWGDEKALLYIYQSALTRPGNAFYPGTGDLPNINFSLFPIDGMRINFVLPIGSDYVNGGDGKELEVQDQLADFQLNVVYNFEDLGQLNVSFVGRGGLAKDKMNSNSVGNLYASFYLTALGPLKLDLGLVYGIPWYDSMDQVSDGYVGIGLGLLYDPGAKFTFKFRTNVRVGGTKSDDDLNTLVFANILPCYKITNNLWFFFYAGVSMILPQMATVSNPDKNPTTGWFVNPYIWVRAAEGLRFWTGLQIYQIGVIEGADPVINWKIPFGFNFYF